MTAPSLRLFPILGAALALLLLVKLFEIAAGLSPATAEDAPAAPPAAAAAAAPAPARGEPAQAELSRSEVEVLQSLSARRAALDAREQEIATREGLLAAAEKRVDERIGELKAIEAQIAALLGTRDEEEEKQIAGLVRAYEAMKPAEAARIFETMDEAMLVALAGRMKPAKIAPILAQMTPSKAKELTVSLASRLKLPEGAPAAPPASVAADPAFSEDLLAAPATVEPAAGE